MVEYKVTEIVKPNMFGTGVSREKIKDATEKSKKKSKFKINPKRKYEKVLKKPKAKLPSYSAKKFVAGLADQQEGLVSPYDKTRARYENPEVDSRSLYFRDTFKKEKKKAFGGFI